MPSSEVQHVRRVPMTAYIAATLPPPSIDRACASTTDRQPPPYTRLLLDWEIRPEPTPSRLSTLPSTGALAGDSSWNPKEAPTCCSRGTRNRHKSHDPAAPRQSRWPRRNSLGYDAKAGHRPARRAIRSRATCGTIPWPTRATYPHGGPACYPYVPATGMREQWRILIYSVCAGQPS